jgi:putative ABC transport system ATP-binding protein
MNVTAVMEMVDMSKLYQMGEITAHAMKDVSLRVESSQGAVILGPSGYSMTNLLDPIGRIDSPISGKIRVKGDNISEINKRLLREYPIDNWIYKLPYMNGTRITFLILHTLNHGNGDEKDEKKMFTKKDE